MVNLTNCINVFATASTLYLSINDSVELNILSTADGSFAESTDSIAIGAGTDNATGFTLGVSASSANNTALINTSDPNKTLPSITEAISEETFTSNPTYNNKWGYKPTKLNSSDNSNYLPAPNSTSITVLDVVPTTSFYVIDNQQTMKYYYYHITIGARITNATTPGTYENTFVVTLTANPIIYSITYNANGGSDTVTNIPANVSNQPTNNETIDISNTIPVRDGFDFKGWCTAQTTDGSSCNGTRYNPDGDGTSLSWTIDQTSSTAQSLTLYAMWVVSPPPYMQDTTLSDCQKNVGTNGNPTNIGDELTVVDKRDGKDYTIRYINGVCWMTQNLRFTNTAVPAATSNVTSDKTLSYYDLDSSYTSYNNHCDSTNGYTYACIHDTGNTTNGVYYNFVAASAGTLTGASNNTTPSTEDICPKNWHLPTGTNATNGSDINKLAGNTISGYQTATTGYTAFNAVVGGRYDRGTLAFPAFGFWWSSSVGSYRCEITYRSSNNEFTTTGCTNAMFVGDNIRCARNT